MVMIIDNVLVKPSMDHKGMVVNRCITEIGESSKSKLVDVTRRRKFLRGVVLMKGESCSVRDHILSDRLLR